MIKRNRPIEFPDELVGVLLTKPTLISWVFELNGDKIINDYHRTYQDFSEHIYWEKESETFTLYGIEPINKTYQDIMTNSKIDGTGPIELRAGVFDDRTNSSVEWGGLGQALTYLPKFLRTEVGDKQYVTFNLVVSSQNQLEETWENYQTDWLAFLAINNKTSHLPNPVIKKEELYVDEWMAAVDESVTMLKESSVLDKIVLARQLKVTTESTIQLDKVLINLREQQPNTYRFVVRYKDNYFIGATPERLIEATKTHFATVCVAGSIQRGQTLDEDTRLGKELLKDTKNIVEHHYVVKWLTERMSLLTTQLDELTDVNLLKNRDIQHLFLPIRGIRKDSVSFEDSIRELHPSPALGGLPKAEAMTWIQEHEVLPRGLYGGPLGWINLQEDIGEMVVGIRSALVSDNQAILYAGCGIVEASEPALEREETKVKFQPMLRALGGINYE